MIHFAIATCLKNDSESSSPERKYLNKRWAENKRAIQLNCLSFLAQTKYQLKQNVFKEFKLVLFL